MISVGIFPVKSSVAIGQPPKPLMAPSNRIQPAAYAAATFSMAESGVEWTVLQLVGRPIPRTHRVTGDFGLNSLSSLVDFTLL